MTTEAMDAFAALVAQHLAAQLMPLFTDHEQLLTYPEVAERLKVSESTAREIGKSGAFPEVKVGQGQRKAAIRVSQKALDEFIRRGGMNETRQQVRRLA